MDKNYTVDDILLDIKSKKMRDRGAAEQAAPPAQPQEQFPGSGAGGKNGVAFAPGPFEGEDSLPAQEPEEPRGQTLQEPRQAPPKMQEPADYADSDSPFQQDFAELQGDEEFEPPGGERSRNPLDFEGHVRPITDRAKIRRGKNTGLKKGGRKQASIIDFSRFRSRGGGAGRLGDPLPDRHHVGQGFRRGVGQIYCVLLRYHKRVAAGKWAGVEDGQVAVLFVDADGRRLAGDDRTEHTRHGFTVAPRRSQ